MKQGATAESEKQRKKDQVKIWMQDANGINIGLQRIVRDNFDKRYTSKNDIANSVWSLQASAFALYQSLYEERCVTEDEYKQSRQELREQIKKQQEEAQKQERLTQATMSSSPSKMSARQLSSYSPPFG